MTNYVFVNRDYDKFSEIGLIMKFFIIIWKNSREFSPNVKILTSELALIRVNYAQLRS